MKVILTESQYVTLKENVKKEKYRTLVFSLLKTLFGELTIKDEYDGRGKKYIHNIYDQHGEDIASIFLGDHANKGCKKDLTLNQETSERLEGYIPYFRHKMFSKVIVDYIYDKFNIKCDCVHYDYNFEREIRYNDDDDEEYEYLNYATRKYNVKKKKKIKESVDKNKKFLIDVMGMDFTDKIKMITSTYDVPMSFDEGVGPEYIRRVLNYFGPMYLVDIDGKKYLYQYRTDNEDGDFEWFHDEHGFNYVDGEIPEQLGISEMGLKFSDIIDMFFNEEDNL
jgi:hypothetical protein